MTRHFRILLTLLLLAAFAVPGRPATLQLARGQFGSGKAYVRCTLDAIDQLCVLDTGSLLSIVADPENFNAYPVEGKIRFQSAAGVPLEGEKVRIGKVKFDRAVFSNVIFARLPPGNKVQSTIGMNLLGHNSFTVNFRDEAALHIGRKPMRPPRDELEVYPSGMFTIPVRLGANTGKAVWDTGAELTAVNRAYVADHPEDFTFQKTVNSAVDGTDREVQAELYSAREIVMGGRRFQNVNVLAIDFGTIHQGTAADVHAVIGFNIIRKTDWHFDLKARRWSVR
jgi:hypothetical protein